MMSDSNLKSCSIVTTSQKGKENLIEEAKAVALLL